MPSSITITNNVSSYKQELAKQVDGIMNVGAIKIATIAKQLAPKDEGILAGSISADTSKQFEKHIIANTPYAAFVEFGTGKYAAEYVASLPADWQDFAQQFKGQTGGGTWEEFLMHLTEWVHRHGIGEKKKYADTRKTIRKKKYGTYEQAESRVEMEAAYRIARSIIINGIHAQPYLFPAYSQIAPDIIQKIKAILPK